MPEQETRPVNKYLPPRPKTAATSKPKASRTKKLDAAGSWVG